MSHFCPARTSVSFEKVARRTAHEMALIYEGNLNLIEIWKGKNNQIKNVINKNIQIYFDIY